MATSPTQRSLADWREHGEYTAVVERWNPHARIRQDLFGFIDILHVGHGTTYGIQCTSRSGLSARKKKILTESTKPSKAHPEGVRYSDVARTLLLAGWKICVEGWDKKPKTQGAGYRVKREWLWVNSVGDLQWTEDKK